MNITPTRLKFTCSDGDERREEERGGERRREEARGGERR
jgi:hypothetical protein